MDKSITTIEQLGDEMRAGFRDLRGELREHIREEREINKSIGEHLLSIENRLDGLADLIRLRERVDQMARNIREKLNVEV